MVTTTITRDELQEKIGKGEQFVLIEALPAFAYMHGHLPGALNIPPDRVSRLAPKLLNDKTAEIIVYCSRFT